MNLYVPVLLFSYLFIRLAVLSKVFVLQSHMNLRSSFRSFRSERFLGHIWMKSSLGLSTTDTRQTQPISGNSGESRGIRPWWFQWFQSQTSQTSHPIKTHRNNVPRLGGEALMDQVTDPIQAAAPSFQHTLKYILCLCRFSADSVQILQSWDSKRFESSLNLIRNIQYHRIMRIEENLWTNSKTTPLR